MNTASNIVQFDNQADFQGSSNTITTTDATSNTVIQNVCGSCGQLYYGYHTCPSYNWYQNWYPVQGQRNTEVNELKSWIDGFMTGRKMTEKNLQKIQDKLADFVS